MKKVVRVGTLQQQDQFRREDIRGMSPSARVTALINMRDRAFPYEPLKRIACVRSLG